MAAWLFTEVVTHDLLFAHGWFPAMSAFSLPPISIRADALGFISIPRLGDSRGCFASRGPPLSGTGECETGASIFGDSAALLWPSEELGEFRCDDGGSNLGVAGSLAV